MFNMHSIINSHERVLRKKNTEQELADNVAYLRDKRFKMLASQYVSIYQAFLKEWLCGPTLNKIFLLLL